MNIRISDTYAGGQNACLVFWALQSLLDQVRAVIQAQDCALRLFFIASTNSAASIHLPVPVITDPEDP